MVVIKSANLLTPRTKPWLMQCFLTFYSMDRTLHWKAVEQYFTVVQFVFQFYLVCNFELGTVWSKTYYCYQSALFHSSSGLALIL